MITNNSGLNVSTPPPDYYLGWNPRQSAKFASLALAGGVGQIATIPGPAAGYFRVFDNISIVSNTIAAGIANTTVDLIDAAAVAWRYTPGVIGAGATITNNIRCGPLAVNETIKVTNATVNAGTISYSYYDIQNPYLTLFRMTVGAVLTTIIPTPPAGFVRHFYQSSNLQTTTKSLVPAILIYNNDTIAHSFQFSLNGFILGRSSPNAGNSNLIAPNTMGQVLSTDGPLQGQTTEAVVTNPLNVVGAYETIPIVY